MNVHFDKNGNRTVAVREPGKAYCAKGTTTGLYTANWDKVDCPACLTRRKAVTTQQKQARLLKQQQALAKAIVGVRQHSVDAERDVSPEEQLALDDLQAQLDASIDKHIALTQATAQ